MIFEIIPSAYYTLWHRRNLPPSPFWQLSESNTWLVQRVQESTVATFTSSTTRVMRGWVYVVESFKRLSLCGRQWSQCSNIQETSSDCKMWAPPTTLSACVQLRAQTTRHVAVQESNNFCIASTRIVAEAKRVLLTLKGDDNLGEAGTWSYWP